MIWKFLKQNLFFSKGLNWVQHWVSQLGLWRLFLSTNNWEIGQKYNGETSRNFRQFGHKSIKFRFESWVFLSGCFEVDLLPVHLRKISRWSVHAVTAVISAPINHSLFVFFLFICSLFELKMTKTRLNRLGVMSNFRTTIRWQFAKFPSQHGNTENL